MIYIFDFDDVIIDNTRKFKKHMFSVIERAGIPEKDARDYYVKVRVEEFSLLNFLKVLFPAKNSKSVQKIYKDILSPSDKFLNKEILRLVEKNGKKNCYIVTNGDKKFQLDKIKYCHIDEIFHKSHIFIVPGSKKTIISTICKKYKNKKVVYYDDKKKFFKDLPLKELPNLHLVEYTRFK